MKGIAKTKKIAYQDFRNLLNPLVWQKEELKCKSKNENK